MCYYIVIHVWVKSVMLIVGRFDYKTNDGDI